MDDTYVLQLPTETELFMGQDDDNGECWIDDTFRLDEDYSPPFDPYTSYRFFYQLCGEIPWSHYQFVL